MTLNSNFKYLRTLWVIIFISGVVVVARETGEAQTTPVSLTVLHRIFGIFLVSILLGGMVLKRIKLTIKGPMLFFTLFAVWQIISSFWSVMPLWTAYRSYEYLLVGLLTTFSVYSSTNINTFIKWLNLIYIWIAFLLFTVWVGAFVEPEQAFAGEYVSIYREGLLSGVFPKINSNSVSAYAGALGIVSISRWYKTNNVKWIVALFICIITMLLAFGRSGIFGFMFALLVLLVFNRKYKTLITITFLFVIILISTNYIDIFTEFMRRGQRVDQFWHFTGRLYIWEYAYNNYIINEPLIGYGAYAAGRFLVLKDYVGWSSLHSTWVEVIVGSGFIGIVLLTILTISIFKKLFVKCKDAHGEWAHNYYVEVLCIFTLLLARSIVSVSLITFNEYLFFLCLGTSLFVFKNQQKYKYK